MSSQKLLLLLLMLLTSSASAVDFTKHDKSFHDFCAKVRGDYQESTTPNEGDKCTILNHSWQSDSEESMFRFCRRSIPFTITKVEFIEEGIFKCYAESTAVCEEGWDQLYGVCFKLIPEMMKRKDVEAKCTALRAGSKPGFYHNWWLLTRHFPFYYYTAWRMWIDASEAIRRRVKWRKGENLMIISNLAGYNWQGVQVDSFVLVDDSFEAMPLCQYHPDVTHSRIRYLLERYSEIYYPSIVTAEGESYIRSTSSLQRDAIDKNAHNAYCAGVMKPFFKSLYAQSAIPTKELIGELTEGRSPGFVRFSTYSQDANEANRLSKECTFSEAKNYGTDVMSEGQKMFFDVLRNPNVWRSTKTSKWPKETCDGGTWSSGLSLSRAKSSDDTLGLETMSDARYGPIYCQTLFETVKYADCPAGYTAYERKMNGQKWCHKFVNEKKVQAEAEAYCQREGAHLDGYEDEDELNFLFKLAEDNGLTFVRESVTAAIWIGAKRREICATTKGGFNRDPNHQCARRRCFEWHNGVAPNRASFEDKFWMPNEPNLQGGIEQCVFVLKGSYPSYWSIAKADRRLNDINCYVPVTFACGKEAGVVRTKIVQDTK